MTTILRFPQRPTLLDWEGTVALMDFPTGEAWVFAKDHRGWMQPPGGGAFLLYARPIYDTASYHAMLDHLPGLPEAAFRNYRQRLRRSSSRASAKPEVKNEQLHFDFESG
jgi:hypothetical protein